MREYANHKIRLRNDRIQIENRFIKSVCQKDWDVDLTIRLEKETDQNLSFLPVRKICSKMGLVLRVSFEMEEQKWSQLGENGKGRWSE